MSSTATDPGKVVLFYSIMTNGSTCTAGVCSKLPVMHECGG